MAKRIVLVIIFISYLLFSLSLLFNLTFLNKSYYSRVLDESRVVEKLYIKILSDKTLQNNFNQALQDTRFEEFSEDIYSLIGSTIYLLLPPQTAENSINAVISRTVDFLRGEKISTANLDSSVIFNKGAAKSLIRSYLISERNVDTSIYQEDLNQIDVFLDKVATSINESINDSQLINTLRDIQPYTAFFSETMLLLSLFSLLISVSYYYYISKSNFDFWFDIFKSVMLASSFGIFMMGLVFAFLKIKALEVNNFLLSEIVTYVFVDFFKINALYFGFVTLLTFVMFIISGRFFKRDSVTKALGYTIFALFLFIALGSIIKYFFTPQKCNGLVEICNKPVNEVVFATTHNSMSIAEYGWLWPSHDGNITSQLNYGIRGFLIDTHYYDIVNSISGYFPNATEQEIQTAQDFANRVGFETRDGTFLCHITCQLGSTPLKDTLTEFKTFLDENKNEVIVLIIEDRITAEDTQLAFVESGLEKYVYTHTADEWPTVKELIKNNKRVIVMAENQGPPPQWYLNAWDYTMETPFSFGSVNQLLETESCAPNRGGTNQPFFLLNNWVERVSPSRIDATIVNEYGFLMNRIEKCEQKRGKTPNFIAVNFFYNGDVINVVNDLNKR